MIIQSLELANFRNIEKAALTFSETLNVIRGKNAQGKTNLLEALHLFSLGRSFRTRRNEEMVMFDREYLFARATFRSDAGVGLRMEMALERGGRMSAALNGNKLAAVGEIIGIVPAVIFEPGDVSLAAGPPADRRTFIDYTAAQVSPAFLRDLREYRRVVAQRNALLRKACDEGRKPEGIGPWDEMLVDRGAAIVEGRCEMLREIAGRAAALYAEITEGSGRLDIEYACSFGWQEGDVRSPLAAALGRLREQERRRGYTMAGPHYDDIRIFLGGNDVRRYGSQGRKRLIAIILRLAQASAIADRRAERPVVMLDDILSELDEPTTRRVNDHLAGRCQSFITTPRDEDFCGSGARTYAIAGGRVSSFVPEQ